MPIDLTPAEARALIDLLDLACKAGGLNAAVAALPIAAKVQSAIEATTPTEDAR
jgi:hypothetical protein